MKNKCKNVLHIIDHLAGGGAQSIVRNLIVQDVNNFYFYVLRKSRNQEDLKLDRVVMRASYSKFGIRPLIEIIKLIRKNKIDILHLHLKRSIYLGIVISLFVRNIKIIVHEHGNVFYNAKTGRKDFSYNTFLRFFQNKVDLFIAVSEITKKKLMENAGIPEKKIKVLYNFVELEKFNPEVLKKYDRNRQRKKLGIRGGDFVIGFAGRLSNVKGCEHLIKSIPYINIPDFKVLIAGDGVDRKNLEKLAEKLNVTEKIIFLGYVKEILNFYGIIDVLIVPSKSESFGISVIEAQACGVPVIASNVGAINELIKNEENGLLFEFANEKDLAEKIELIEKDKDLRERLIKNGLCSVKEYSLENCLEVLDLVYGGVKTENGCNEIG